MKLYQNIEKLVSDRPFRRCISRVTMTTEEPFELDNNEMHTMELE